MLQTYGRNLKKVSNQDWMCLQLMHWMNVKKNIIIKLLLWLWNSLPSEGACRRGRKAQEVKCYLWKPCLLVECEDGKRLDFNKLVVQEPSVPPCYESARSLFFGHWAENGNIEKGAWPGWDFKQPDLVEDVPSHGRVASTGWSPRFLLIHSISLIFLIFNYSITPMTF